MKHIFFKSTIVLISIWSTAFAQYRPEIEKYKLPNGFTVILNYDEHQSGVFGAIGVKVGSKNDPDDATGMAHYQEHMLFKGTSELGTVNYEQEKLYIDSIFLMYDELAKTSDEIEREKVQKTINRLSVKANEYAAPNEFSNLIKTMGGTGLNAFTSPDITVYHNTFPSNQMEKWLELYSHRFINPVFRGFQSELEVVYEEYNMNADNFGFNLFQDFQKNFFKQHPYGSKTTIGTVEHLKSPSLTKMYEFFETYYVANNMVLVLSGNFNVAKTKSLIEQKFARLRTGQVPEFVAPKEQQFNGREFIEKKLSPIKLGALGFRTVPIGHEDEYKLKIVNLLLNNSSGSGLLDELMTENELLMAQITPLPFHDEGGTIIIFIPKIIGQKLEEAEKLIINKIKKVHNGEFEDWMLASAKNSIYIQEQRKFESKQQVALDILNAEIIGLDLNDYFNSSERIMNFSKDEIIETAKKYYGKNYLSFYSKQNLNPSKEKINKPNYDPVVPNAEAESNYATNFKSISSDNIKINLVDFNNAITKTNLKGAHTCYHTHNPKNDVFNLKIAYKVGSNEIEMLKYAGMVMDLAGTENISANRLRDTFNYLNCSFSFNVTDDRFYFSIQGLEQNIEQVMPIVGELLNQPTLQDKNLKTIVQGEKTNRKLEKTEADAIADALFEYMRFGKKSSYLDRLTMKELKKLETQTIIDAFKLSTQYEAAIHYSGKKEPSVIANLMAEFIPLNETPKRVNNEDFKHSKYHDKNTIYFVPKKNARQSKVYLVLNEFEYGPDKIAAINAFNLYFGGDFSGLVLQEIREYRSLAYTAGAWVTTPNYPTKPCGFVGFVGTQADKTNEAMDIYYELLTNMPQKPERTTLVKEYLINKLQNDQPSFRSLSSKIAWWQQMGYESDPRADLLKQYENLTFGDIVDFYNRHLQQNTISMAISGDPREIDLEALEQYGKVIELKSKDIVSK